MASTNKQALTLNDVLKSGNYVGSCGRDERYPIRQNLETALKKLGNRVQKQKKERGK